MDYPKYRTEKSLEVVMTTAPIVHEIFISDEGTDILLEKGDKESSLAPQAEATSKWEESLSFALVGIRRGDL